MRQNTEARALRHLDKAYRCLSKAYRCSSHACMHAKERPSCCGFLSLRLDQKQRAITKKDSAPYAGSLRLGTTGSEYMANAACTAVPGKYRYCFTRGYGRTGVAFVPKKIIGSFPRGGQCRYARCTLHRKGGVPSLALRVSKEYPRVGIRKICAEKTGGHWSS